MHVTPAAGPLPSPARPHGPIPHPTADDLAYINDIPADSIPSDRCPAPRSAPSAGDDFVTVPLPRLAARITAASASAVVQATARYQHERRVVDRRLYQPVTVAMPRGDLGELLDRLTRQTGVRLDVARDQEDLKLTVLAASVPVRDLMRQLIELFDLQWRRYDGAGGYRYELSQSVAQRLAEEEKRRSDEDQMLLDATRTLEPYLADLDAPAEQLRALAAEARGRAASVEDAEERAGLLAHAGRLEKIANNDEIRDGLAVYARLTPGELVALRNGETLTLSSAVEEPAIPRDVAERRAGALRARMAAEGRSADGISPADIEVTARFSLKPNGLDRKDLMVQWDERVTKPGVDPYESTSPPMPLASGRPDRLRRPGNAAEHTALRALPAFQLQVSLDPHPGEISPQADALSGPAVVEGDQTGGGATGAASAGDTPNGAAGPVTWIDSADLFAEIQRRTGRAIVADYYTRAYPASSFRAQDEPLLDILNHTADILKSDWQADGPFLRFRRFDYYTARDVEIPNRLLRRWIESRRRLGYVSLDDLAEIAVRRDPTLEPSSFEQALSSSYPLEEWPLTLAAREELRFYARLDPLQRQQAQSEAGLALAALTRDQYTALVQAFEPPGDNTLQQGSGGRFWIRLREPGVFEWYDWVPETLLASGFPVQATVHEATREQAAAAVRSRLTSGGNSEAQIQSEIANIRGPGSGVLIRLQVGDGYVLEESSNSDHRELRGTSVP